MVNKTYGSVIKNRALSVFLALFDYVYADLDNPQAGFSSKDFDWREDGLTVFFNVKNLSPSSVAEELMGIHIIAVRFYTCDRVS